MAGYIETPAVRFVQTSFMQKLSLSISDCCLLILSQSIFRCSMFARIAAGLKPHIGITLAFLVAVGPAAAAAPTATLVVDPAILGIGATADVMITFSEAVVGF
ncbi:hypothetical protein N8D56_16660 [Devosia sp. A8/3-2]|nr:hypothetical protein N8D56_16660 [Devosia sp. A8/3-2]